MNEAQKIEAVLSRGVENIISNREELEQALTSGRKLNVYLGIDPTATRIHLGHAVPLRKLQLLAELGHNVTFLIGDYTALVGDTSDKDTERPVLTSEQISENFATYRKQAEKLLDFDLVTVRHNSEWLSKLTFKELLGLMRHFSVNDFVSRELIRKRLDAGTRVSLPETLYPIMQGYDSYVLDTHIQLGGTDQTFNMQAGRTLIKRLRDHESYIIANGFLTGTDGRKMSKSWGNAIWLDDAPEDMYGKIMSIKDDLIGEYFLLGTNLPAREIEAQLKRLEDGENPMAVKKTLAEQVVRELHGEEAIEPAAEHFRSTVQEKSAAEDAPVAARKAGALSQDELAALIVEHGLAGSKSEARRLFDQGGIYLDDERFEDCRELAPGSHTVRVGKRRYLKIDVA